MTAGEIALYGWELAGEDSRYDGNDLTTADGLLLLERLNAAYAVIASYKFPRTGLIRFRALERVAIWRNLSASFPVTGLGDDNSQVTSSYTDGAVGDVVSVAGSRFEIVRVVSAGTYQVAPVPVAGVNGQTGTLYKSRVIDLSAQPTGHADALSRLASASKVVEVFDVYDLERRQEIFRSSNTDFLDNGALTPAPPSEYIRTERTKVVLDTAPSELTQLRIRYAELPDDFTSASDIPVIPEQYHEAIGMRLATQILLRGQFYEAARELRVTYENELRRLQTEYERGWDNTPGTIVRDH